MKGHESRKKSSLSKALGESYEDEMKRANKGTGIIKPAKRSDKQLYP